jgi:outer membrane protein TolC
MTIHMPLAGARLAGRAALAAAALAAACTAPPGAALHEAAPTLDARAHVPDETVRTAFEARWDAVSAAWDGTAPLTADAAVRCALANNRVLRRTVLELERRRAVSQDAQLPPNPTLEFAIGAPISMGAVPILAMLAQQVDWVWRRDAIVDEADAQLRTMLLEAAAVTVATAVEIRADYVEAASAHEQRELARRDADVAARVLAAEESAYAAGEATTTAVNQARMNAAEADNRVMEAETQLVTAKTRLLETIGRGDMGIAWRTADLTAVDARRACGIEAPPAPEDDAALHALVRSMRMDLRAAEARVDGARARVSQAEAGRIPSLYFGAGYDRDMEGDSAVMFQLQSQLPLWNDQRYRIAAARAELEMARIDADRAWQRAVIDVRRALTAVAAADHHLATLRERTLASFESNKRLLAQSVEVGERRPIELWRSEHQENHVRIQLVRAERDRALAMLGFERALAGGRLPSGSGGMGSQRGSNGMGAMGVNADPGMPDFEFTALEAMQ